MIGDCVQVQDVWGMIKKIMGVSKARNIPVLAEWDRVARKKQRKKQKC